MNVAYEFVHGFSSSAHHILHVLLELFVREEASNCTTDVLRGAVSQICL